MPILTNQGETPADGGKPHKHGNFHCQRHQLPDRRRPPIENNP